MKRLPGPRLEEHSLHEALHLAARERKRTALRLARALTPAQRAAALRDAETSGDAGAAAALRELFKRAERR